MNTQLTDQDLAIIAPLTPFFGGDTPTDRTEAADFIEQALSEIVAEETLACKILADYAYDGGLSSPVVAEADDVMHRAAVEIPLLSEALAALKGGV